MNMEHHNTQETKCDRPAYRLRKLAPEYSENMPEQFKDAAVHIREKTTGKKKKKTWRLFRYRRAAAWMLFLAVGGAMAAMRYGGWLDLQTELKEYGPYVVLGLHALVTLMAFSEDIFTGFLCLVIPGFSLYYLLARSGQAFFCAIVCGLLVGLGEDSWYALQAFAMDLHEKGNSLLAGDRR